MASPLTLLRRFEYHAVRDALVVQTTDIALTIAVGRALRKHFPGARVDAVVRDDDAATITPDEFDHVTPVRWEDRITIARELRARRYDVVAMVLGGRSSRAFRLLPYVLRTKNILLFNEHLDYFPLKWTRVRSLAHHVSGHDSILSLFRWGFGRVVLVPLAALFLMASTVRIQLRAARRRRTRVARP